jgi:hypothetical protein
VTSLTLGNVSYTDLQLLSIFNTPAQGNGLLTLAHQLIAAKLNIANGADSTDIAQAISDADALIGSLVVPPVGGGFLAPGATSTLVHALTDYNEGLTGPGRCLLPTMQRFNTATLPPASLEACSSDSVHLNARRRCSLPTSATRFHGLGATGGSGLPCFAGFRASAN